MKKQGPTINKSLLIQALRAFRRAEIVFEAVLFESCVGEAAGSLAVASIFFFEGWYRRVSF